MTDELKNLLTMMRSGPNVETEARRILLAYRAETLVSNRVAAQRGRHRLLSGRPQGRKPVRAAKNASLVPIEQW